MPDITLSPIPYNGGTMTMTNQGSHICMLSATKMFALFGQTNPNYIFGSVIKVDNIKTASAVATVSKQRVLSLNPLTRCRVWKLTENRVLALINSDLVVINVTAEDDMEQTAAKIENFHTTTLWGTEAAATYGIGSFLYGSYIKDNTVWIIQRASTTAPIVLMKIEYDPATDTLTQTSIQNLTASTTATHFWKYHIVQIPSSTNFMVYCHGGNTTPAASTIPNAYIFSDAAELLTTITGIPSTARSLTPLKANKVLALSDARNWRYFDGTSWTTGDTMFAGATVASTNLAHTEPLDSNYFMIQSMSSGVELGSGNYAFRISRVVDKSFGQTSSATNTGNGIAYAVANAYFDQPTVFKVDSNCYLSFGRASTTAFRIRVLAA